MGAKGVTDLHFPKAGLHVATGLGKQPARPAYAGRYARTTAAAVNVRAFDKRGRNRGGSRPGLVRYFPDPVVADWMIQELTTFTTVGDPPGGTMQGSQSGRVVFIVTVSQGNVYAASPDDLTWHAPTNNTGDTPPLNFVGLMQSSPNNQKLYFADGTNAVYYDPHTDTVETWVASVGTLPVDSATNRPRLICTYRGRTVQSGLLLDSQNWFMSRVSDPTDWEYGATPDGTEAVAGNNSPLGLIGDVITALIPVSDDVMLFGGDSSIYRMRGDPASGGQIDLVTRSVGVAWGQAWCQGPDGTVYFMSNKAGVYAMPPEGQPVRISQAIDPLLNEINTGTSGVRLMWNDAEQGFYLFVSPLQEPGETTHYFYDARNGAWFPVSFGDTDFDPLTCVVIDGNDPEDRVAVIGSWDGYVRAFDPAALTDDGVNIESEVWIGPLLTPTLDEVTLQEIQGVLADDSGDVTWEVYVGDTAEAALASTAVETGTLSGGRNFTELVRRSAHTLYVRLSATVPWAMESIRAVLFTRGKVRGRSRR